MYEVSLVTSKRAWSKDVADLVTNSVPVGTEVEVLQKVRPLVARGIAFSSDRIVVVIAPPRDSNVERLVAGGRVVKTKSALVRYLLTGRGEQSNVGIAQRRGDMVIGVVRNNNGE